MMGGYMSKTSGRPHWLQTRCVLEWLNPWESVHFPSALQPLSTPFIFSQNVWKANYFLIISYLPNSPFLLQPPPHPQGSRGVSAWTCHIQCLFYCGQSNGYRTTLGIFFFFFFFGYRLKWESSMFSRLFTFSYLILSASIFGPGASGSISGLRESYPNFISSRALKVLCTLERLLHPLCPRLPWYPFFSVY